MSDGPVSRTILPIPDVPHIGLTTYDAKDPDTSYPPIRDVRPPQDAPNVLVVLIDDVGFGASSAFGGPCQTPNFEQARLGRPEVHPVRTPPPLCSPTPRRRCSAGRNHHSVGMGGVTEIATAAPGYSSVLPNTKAPLAVTLKLNGYSTAQFGKCHEVPVWQTSPAGPFTAWPTGGGGFEYFYGFIGGENNQFHPALYEGTGGDSNPRKREKKLVPDAVSWWGWITIASFFVVSAIPFVTTGPLAFNGVISFWIAFFTWFFWIPGLSYFIIKAIPRLQAEDEAAGRVDT